MDETRDTMLCPVCGTEVTRREDAETVMCRCGALLSPVDVAGPPEAESPEETPDVPPSSTDGLDERPEA